MNQQQQQQQSGLSQNAAMLQDQGQVNGSTQQPLMAASVLNGGQQPLAPNLMNFLTNPSLATNPFPPAMLNIPGFLGGIPGMAGGFAPPQNIGSNAAVTSNQNGPNGQMNFSMLGLGGLATPGFPQAVSQPLGLPSLAPLAAANQPTSAAQVKVAAAAAAAAAAPLKGGQGKASSNSKSKKTEDMSSEEKAKMNRERNREHARSTRLRKKAYVQKLKELVEGLHAERTEEMRKRRVAVQHLADVQNARRSVVRSFLRNHASYESGSDPKKWETLLEDNFWFKQPVTPYRSFRRSEIEQECRVSRGVDALVADAASLAVMVEGMGSRSARWMQIKRHETLQRAESRIGASHPPQSIGVEDSSRLQHAVSSLSSSSGSSHGSSGDEEVRKRKHGQMSKQAGGSSSSGTNGEAAKKVSASTSGSGSDDSKPKLASEKFHEYNAPDLPDPMIDDEGPSDESPESSGADSNDGGEGNKQVGTGSSSEGDDDKSDSAIAAPKRRKLSSGVGMAVLPPNIARKGGIAHNVQPIAPGPIANANGDSRLSVAPAITLPPFAGLGKRAALPPLPNATTVTVAAAKTAMPTAPVLPSATVAKSVTGSVAVSVSLAGQSISSNQAVSKGNVSNNGGVLTKSIVIPDADNSSTSSSCQFSQIRAYYHLNEDDMLLTDDVLMCPFIFRSQDAVLCGALAECIMPGMLRAHFSSRNKLMSLEMVYDAMGFMQQLERASGSDGTAQIVAGSLEMALAPNSCEARAITLAKEPFPIVSVNEAWTKLTKYTQMEVEGKDLSILNGKRTCPKASKRRGKPDHAFGEVAQGRAACSTNIYYDKDGREFVIFKCSYPLTNANDEITHILHVCKELPVPSSPSYAEYQESRETSTSFNSSDNVNQ